LPFTVALVGWGGTPHQPTNLHSSKWTHVMRNNRNYDDFSEEELLKIFNQNAKQFEKPVVATRMFNSRSSFAQVNSHACKKIVKEVLKKNRKPNSKNPFHVDHVSLANLKLQISKNYAILKKELGLVSPQIKSVKQSLKRSADTVLAQKALYSKLTKCIVDHLPSYWIQQRTCFLHQCFLTYLRRTT
jgi:hypothetical protein